MKTITNRTNVVTMFKRYIYVLKCNKMYENITAQFVKSETGGSESTDRNAGKMPAGARSGSPTEH